MDDCDDIAADGASLYLACHSDSNDFPGAPTQTRVNGGMDAYVVRIDSSANTILWAVRLGGSRYDGAFRIRTDPGGGVWVAGYTESADFPTTTTAVQPRFGGGDGDGFLARIDAAGRVSYSSYFGGSGADQLTDVAVAGGRVHVSGMTSSPDLPRRRNGHSGMADAFLASIDPSHADSSQSQYMGGANDDKPTALAVQADGTLVIAGYTLSADFPTRTPLQGELRGSSDAFIARVRASSGEVLSSTFHGGSGNDSALGVAPGRGGEVHISGFTDSADFPTAAGALQPRLAGGALQPRLAGGADVFVTILDGALSRVRYSSYFGGSGNDIPGVDGKNVAVDPQGRTWIAGMTESRDLPLRHAYQPSFGGGDRDGFIAVLASSGESLSFASYHGGKGRDVFEGLAVTRGLVFATGLSFGDVQAHGAQLPHGAGANAMLVGLRQ